MPGRAFCSTVPTGSLATTPKLYSGTPALPYDVSQKEVRSQVPPKVNVCRPLIQLRLSVNWKTGLLRMNGVGPAPGTKLGIIGVVVPGLLGKLIMRLL